MLILGIELDLEWTGRGGLGGWGIVLEEEWNCGRLRPSTLSSGTTNSIT